MTHTDELIDLLEEPTVEEAHPTTDCDLDSLLSEAITLADARKAVRKSAGKRQIDPALADIVQAADAALTWLPEYTVARFAETHCTCGASHRRFDGWFVVSQHRRDPHARRFVRSDSHHDLPAWQYTAVEEVDFCGECVSEFALPHATIDQLTGIDALGTPAECCGSHYEQLCMRLEAAEAAAIDEGDTELDLYDGVEPEGADHAA